MEGRGDKEAPLDPEGEPVCGCWEEWWWELRDGGASRLGLLAAGILAAAWLGLLDFLADDEVDDGPL